MTRDTIGRESAAVRQARASYTRASRAMELTLREYHEAVRRSEADPGNRQLRSLRASLHERCAAATLRMSQAKARYHDAEAAERGGWSDE